MTEEDLSGGLLVIWSNSARFNSYMRLLLNTPNRIKVRALFLTVQSQLNGIIGTSRSREYGRERFRCFVWESFAFFMQFCIWTKIYHFIEILTHKSSKIVLIYIRGTFKTFILPSDNGSYNTKTKNRGALRDTLLFISGHSWLFCPQIQKI